MNPRDKLRQAAALIDEALGGMTVESRICPCCSHEHVVNWSTKQARDRLEEMPGKLRRVAGSDACDPAKAAKHQHA